MFDLNFTSVVLLTLLIGALIFIGREFEERYPNYVDYKDGEKSTIIQQLRSGAFVALDYASDILYPGTRGMAVRYKQSKRTYEQEQHQQAAARKQ